MIIDPPARASRCLVWKQCNRSNTAAKVPSSIAVCLETDALPCRLDMSPLSFGIDLASLYFVTLEATFHQWLNYKQCTIVIATFLTLQSFPQGPWDQLLIHFSTYNMTEIIATPESQMKPKLALCVSTFVDFWAARLQ